MHPVARPTIDEVLAAIRQRIIARQDETRALLIEAIEARTQAARTACRSEDTFYALRQLYPDPGEMEGT
jgi:hypothetical protein